MDEAKVSRNRLKISENQLTETTNLLEIAMDESAAEIQGLKEKLKVANDLLAATNSAPSPKAPTQVVIEDEEVEVLIEMCKACSFSTKSKAVLKSHMNTRHKGHSFIPAVKTLKCLMCSDTFKDKQSLKKHKAEHQKELDVITFEHYCKECSLSYGCRDDYLEHLLQEHRPAKEKPSENKKLEACKNGQRCKYLKEDRCNFSHTKEAWKTVEPRRQRQKPKSQENSMKIQDACRNGPNCWFFKNKKCIFSHAQPSQGHRRHETRQRAMEQWNNGQEQGGHSTQLKQCKYGNKSDKVMTCGFLHLPTDFLPLQGRRKH